MCVSVVRGPQRLQSWAGKPAALDLAALPPAVVACPAPGSGGGGERALLLNKSAIKAFAAAHPGEWRDDPVMQKVSAFWCERHPAIPKCGKH